MVIKLISFILSFIMLQNLEANTLFYPKLAQHRELRDLTLSFLDCESLPFDEMTNLQRNRRRAMVYANIYQQNQDWFPWAGLAALSSDLVGFATHFSEFVSPLSNKKGRPLRRWEWSRHQLSEFLRLGGEAIYETIVWQFEAYRNYGIVGIRQLHAERHISDNYLNIWENLDNGKISGERSLIERSVFDIARVEQEVSLQGVIDQSPQRKLVVRLMSPVMYSPVPGDWRIFQFSSFLGDFSKFQDRWHWVETSMIPAYLRYMHKFQERLGQKLEVIKTRGENVCIDS